MYTMAITRKPGRNFAQGITSSRLGTPDYDMMIDQHLVYIETLRSLGLQVIVLEALDAFPDAYFVEDTAIVTPEVAVITRPGAISRRGEEAAIEPVLAQYRRIEHITPPATLEGGDVLVIGRWCFIGISQRTNREGAAQLGQILEGYGYTWVEIPLQEGLHLKSGVNCVGKNTLLVTKEFDKLPMFKDFKKIVINKDEEYAANTLLVNECLITPKGFHTTREKLSELGFPIFELEMSEVRKMDGGLTCMSLRF